MSSQNTKFISLHEAAKLTDYSQDYISLLCRRRKLKGEKLGRNWFTTKEWVNEYVSKISENKENNKSEEKVVPVRIIRKNEVRKICKVNKIGKTGKSPFSLVKKIILTVVVSVVVVGGIFFIQYWTRQNLTFGVSKNQTVGVSDSVNSSLQKKLLY